MARGRLPGLEPLEQTMRTILLCAALALAACRASGEAPAAPADEHAAHGHASPGNPPAAGPPSSSGHGYGPPGSYTDWCGGHAIPESMCTKCNKALVEKFRAAGDYCEEHGFPESACPTCNPRTRPAPPAAEPARGGHGFGPPGSHTDWCGRHGLPESMCTKCNRELVATFKAAGDWCDEHGFPESACPTCNPRTRPEPPGAAPVAADWCREHGLPESKCTRCNADLVAGYKASGDWCPEHGYPESVCPICNPQPAPDAENLYAGLEVRLRSEAVERAAGLTVTPAREAELASSVRAVARLAWDERRMAEVGAPVSGVVKETHAVPGEPVEAGAPLFVITSAEVGELRARLAGAKERVAAARAEVARQKQLQADLVASARDVAEAKRELAAAQADQRATEAALAVSGGPAATGDVVVTAPMSGVVLERASTRGAVVQGGAILATLVDPATLWVLVDVPETDAASVAVGHDMHVTIGGSVWEARIEQVAPSVDFRTRTVRARATLDNPDGRLRAGQLARARIHVTPADRAVAVPRSAIQRVEDSTLVFVRTAPQVYEPRVVRAVRRSDDLVQITGSVAPGEEVVTAGAWLLRTEVVPGSIGAGCCGD